MMLPNEFYTAKQVKEGEILAAKQAGISLYSLMQRAGSAVLDILRQYYPMPKHVLVCCGGGNNGGDGYVLARLLLKAGIKLTVWSTHQSSQLTGDAHQAYCDFVAAGGKVNAQTTHVADDVDVIVDALLGTGLSGVVKEPTAALISLINISAAQVIAVDIPSGLCADTGAVLGECVAANHTVTFIGIKQGLVTARARDYLGKLHFHGLGVEDEFTYLQHAKVLAIDESLLTRAVITRKHTANKGHHGKAILVGGDMGMGGAIILSSSACARSGAGLTAVLTHQANYSALLSHCAEVMCNDWCKSEVIASRITWATAIALGPGLGVSPQAKSLFELICQINKPKVFDADGLNLLALSPNYDAKRIITPHPGEAARLLACTVADIEGDRYAAVRELQHRFGGVTVLKGAGTLVCDGNQVYVCLAGNSGMASGGMGDVLTGVLVSLLAQGYALLDAALIGVQLHSQAADEAVKISGKIGLLASDLVPFIRQSLNKLTSG
ncbi:NAD(P)H-hydrate dehydratase [Shewanella sp. ULN5]|uniref:NAD(P)H-hydrate dehydratase n=1 Tax=Shewanella sp. ULN5 TaxID=2994678 RepID=UPI00273FFCFB|nr:NAD(P)H-hydrate dehydratase [Shewanella sp. ULN5]MDP5147621.1 NAD(P)H-hydrate dehydratase [Shewanella sp. ULN5]